MSEIEGWSEEQFHKKYEDEARKIGRFNLAVFGKTGAGKSTLINAIFGEDVAPTGIGEPVTQGKHFYLHRSGSFGLLDTQGLEIGVDTDTIIDELGEYVEEMRRQPLADQIHVAYYCVRSTDRRFEATEADFIRRLRELKLPVILVLTQVAASQDGQLDPDAITLADHIATLDLPIEGGRPILVMASEDRFKKNNQHGLQELLDATFQAAPEGVENALVASQVIDLARKQAKAKKAIIAASVLAAGVGATPIPIADAALLVPIQLGLMASVSAIYGVKVETATIAAGLATTVATAAGKGIVVGLLKLIPGAGWVVGGAISAATATAFTLAIGYAWSAVCAQLVQGKLTGLGGVLDNDAVVKLFKDELASRLKDLLPKKEKA